jgi:hypothetical protein
MHMPNPTLVSLTSRMVGLSLALYEPHAHTKSCSALGGSSTPPVLQASRIYKSQAPNHLE